MMETIQGPAVSRYGDVTFNFEGLEVTEDPGLQFLIYTTEPGSASDERIRLLGSWAVDQPWAESYVAVQ